MKSKSVSLALLGLLVLAIATTSTGQNRIVNGDFSQNSCGSQWCIFTKGKNNYYVEGWQAQPQIEVGRGTVYSNKFSRSEWVTELDPDSNSCIYQNIGNLSPGIYTLSFEHAARKERSCKDTKFTVSVEGVFSETITHTNYERQSKNYNIRVANACTNVGLRLCGAGTSSSYGAIITNVAFRLTGGIIPGPPSAPGIPLPPTAPVPNIPSPPNPPTAPTAPGFPGFPGSGSGLPGAGFPGSGSGFPENGYPGSGSGLPGTGYPGSGSGFPGNGYPGSGSGLPGTGYPGSGSGLPGSGFPGTGSGFPGAGFPGSGSGFPGNGYPGSGSGLPGTGYPGSGSGLPGGAGYPGSGSGLPGAGYPGSGFPGTGVYPPNPINPSQPC